MGFECRSGESGNAPFRSGRFYNADSKWYFSSREQDDVGPFENKEEADQALNTFLEDLSTLNGLTVAS